MPASRKKKSPQNQNKQTAPLILRLMQSNTVAICKEDCLNCHKPEGIIDSPFAVDLLSADAKSVLADLLTHYAVSAWECAGTRNKVNTTGYLTVIVDFDSGPGFKELQKRFAPWINVIYSTVSSTPDDCHYRVLLPLAQPLTDNSQFDSLRNWLIGHFPDADSKQFTISQMCCPCCPQYRDKTSKKLVDSYAHNHFEISINTKGKLFQLPVFTATKTTKSDCEWTAPPTDTTFLAGDRAALEILLTSYNPPKGQVSRNEAALVRATQCLHVNLSQAEAMTRMLNWNRDFVKPEPYPAYGAANGEDTSIEYIVDRVYRHGYQVSPDSNNELKAARDAVKTSSVESSALSDAPLDDWKILGKRELSPAQCYFNESLYFAVNYQGYYHFLGQNKIIFPFKDAPARGMRFRKDIPQMKFTAVEAYLKGYTVDPSIVFRKVYDYYNDYLILPRADLVYLTLYTMASYSYTMWPAFGYLWFNGDFQCGKTTAMERMAALVFNGGEIAKFSASSLFRTISVDSGTMFLDEAEKLRNEHDGEIDIMDVLNRGYRASGVAKINVKSDKGKDWTPKSFVSYSPKVLASIREIDSTLASRCHKIRMLPTLYGQRPKAYQITPSVAAREESIRNDLYVFALTYACQPPSMVATASDLFNRRFEIWLPILWVAEIVDAANGNTKFSDLMVIEAHKSTDTTWDSESRHNSKSQLLVALKLLFDTTQFQVIKGMRFYPVNTVYSFLKTCKGFENLQDIDRKAWLTMILTDDLAIAEKKKYHNERGYLVNMDTFNDLYKRYVNRGEPNNV